MVPTRVGRIRDSAWALPGVVFVLATFVAALGSWRVSLWTDEAVSISAAARTWPQLWDMVQRIDAVHAVYYAGLKIWTSLFGFSEFSLRLPSALAAGAVSAVTLLLVRRFATPATALTAAVLCAFLPRLTWAGIEARPFVFSALLVVSCALAFQVATESGRSRHWTAYGALLFLGIVTNIYVVLFAAGQGVTVFLRSRWSRRTWLPFLQSSGGAVLLSVPLLLRAMSQRGQLGNSGDQSAVNIARRVLINQHFLGETPSHDALPSWFGLGWQAASIAAAVVGLGLALLACFARARPGDDRASAVQLTLPWLLVPTIAVAAYAVLVSPLYQPRYLTMTGPALAILMAYGLRAIRRRAVAVALLVVYGASVLVVYVSQRTPYSKSGSDWAGAADAVGRLAQPGDSVLFVPRFEDPSQQYSQYTARRIAEAYPQPFAALDDLTLDRTGAETATQDGFSLKIDQVTQRLQDAQVIWVLHGSHYPRDVVDSTLAELEEQGLTGSVRWEGPSTVVMEFVRRD